jgi:hypothetical protein
LFSETAIPFWTAVGSLAAALTVIGAFISWLASLRREARRHTPPAVTAPRPVLVVRRITDPDDSDLPAAYDVYKDGIPEPGERDSFAEIQRWLSEAGLARAAGKDSLDEYLLIAKTGSRVCGFFYGQYYRSHRMFLIGYLVIDRKSRDARRATSSSVVTYLFDSLRHDHPECEGIVFELALQPGKDVRARISKEDLFRVLARSTAGIVVKRLDIEYCQPKLGLWDPTLHEERQHLMYGRMGKSPVGASIPKAEAVHVLDAVYNCWYGDYYADDDPAKDADYRAYVRRIFEGAVSRLPDTVPMM